VSPQDDDKPAKGPKPPKAEGQGKPEGGDKPKGEKQARAEGGDKQAKGGERPAKGGKPEGGDAPKAAKAPKADPNRKPARIKESYVKDVVPRLMKEREYPNVMAVPRLKKVVVNMGVGEATQNIKVLDAAMDELGRITGQKPAMRRSRKSIAAFKLRAGMPIAATVTLRGDRMYEFCDRLFNVALPRVRDFRGVPTNAFDGRGNYTLGLKDQIIFPEVDYAKVDKLRGMNVTFVTSARTDEESKLLLQYLGMPFRTGQEAR
jgi:large subunit ribosomal protein L5